jgi:predicted DNA-binding protein (MmcQ/YjbR family)
VNRMEHLERIAAELPEATRVDIAEWGDHPTFRVRGKNFVFADEDAAHLTVKLPPEEAAAVVATEPGAEPAGYGLGRHGWVSVTVPPRPTKATWAQVREWVRTSYTLVAPKRLAAVVLEEDRLAADPVR